MSEEKCGLSVLNGLCGLCVLGGLCGLCVLGGLCGLCVLSGLCGGFAGLMDCLYWVSWAVHVAVGLGMLCCEGFVGWAGYVG